MKRRLIVVTYGSAGDLFPLVPIIKLLRNEGHEVSCAAPRPLAFHLRALDIPVFHLGRGAEIDALADRRIVTNRFSGWESVRRLADHYAARTLHADVTSMQALIDAYSPDIVLTSTLAASARIAARRQHLPALELSIYPLLLARMNLARRFAHDYRSICLELAGLNGVDPTSDEAGELAWGIRDDTIQLHDPEILRHSDLSDLWAEPTMPSVRNAVGYTYWDDTIRSQSESVLVDKWLEQSETPTVAVTMGSYLGVKRSDLWLAAARTLAGMGVRGLFIGPRRQLHDLLADIDGDWLVVGYVPLSQVLPRVEAVLHHGGLGTTFAALHAGTPAVVVPTAFDQPSNARLVERAGAGLLATERTLGPALMKVVADPSFADRARALVPKLVPSATAAERAADRILQSF